MASHHDHTLHSPKRREAWMVEVMRGGSREEKVRKREKKKTHLALK